MGLKSKIQESIVTPATLSSRDYTAVADVMYANEKLNICSIQFVDKDGKLSNKDNVHVKIYGESFIDWFPSEGDQVVVSVDTDGCTITGKFSGEYSSSVRANNALKKDVLPSSFIDTMAGMLF